MCRRFLWNKNVLIYIDISLYCCIITWYLTSSNFSESTIVHVWNYDMSISKIYYNTYVTIARIISSSTKLNNCSECRSITSCMSFSTSIIKPLICVSWPINILILCYIPSTISPVKGPLWLSPYKLIPPLSIYIFTCSLCSKTVSSRVSIWCRRSYSTGCSALWLWYRGWFWRFSFCSRNDNIISYLKIRSTKKKILPHNIFLGNFVFLSKPRESFTRSYFMRQPRCWKYTKNLSWSNTITTEIIFPSDSINADSISWSDSSKAFSTKHLMFYNSSWSTGCITWTCWWSIDLKKRISRFYKQGSIANNICISEIWINNRWLIYKSSIKVILSRSTCKSSEYWVYREHKYWKAGNDGKSNFSSVLPFFIYGVLKYTWMSLYTSSDINFRSQDYILECKSISQYSLKIILISSI